MKRRRHILGVVSLLMVVSVLDVILMDAIGSEPSPFSVWRLVITGVLAIFLALGNNLARWMAVLLTALAAFGGLAFIALLLVSGEFGPGAGVVLAWMGLLTFTYGTISCYLTFSDGVSREIRRTEEHVQV